ncbi:MAG TPA: DUF6175 family protein [Spirochaetota bacterium]|jgi:hypothetical protein|nr:hypothetical protein [Spirochaetota bacterium]OQA99199.1 MAG: hypothetical protein BWY23_00744 [Spirochaetes bacterium ADurb.Bin218]HOK01427.1 DUF6175 family protein [Spirochaetota bacterium]HOK91560.1 DUF6175 family protein [Spirochaetota bacterium]HON16542.1 DUF6175 family protein [Spirochaetota bacterium]
MKKFIVTLLSLILLAFFVSCGGGKTVKEDSEKSSQKQTVQNRGQETGYATIFDNDTALARDRALDDAKAKLVRKILGETVSGTSIMEDYELVANIVEAKSYGLVKNIKIIKQWQEGTEYFVTIEGTVEPSVVEDAIEDALNRYGRPKFMVLIKETFNGKENMPGFTETEMLIQEIMGNSGFQFVDAAMTQELMKREKAKMQKAVTGNVSEDVQDLLLDDAGAEVIIIGTAETKAQGEETLKRAGATEMKSRSAIIRIKAIDVYTGDILASTSKQAPGLHIEDETASKKAIENALKQILGKTDENGKFKAADFMKTIVNKFVKAANAREIKVLIAGLDANELRNFRDQVSNRIRGVSQVIEKGRVGKAARLEVIFAGKTNDFEQELTAKASNMGFEIDVKSSRPNKLEIVAKKIK